jgi:hypothetical protein
MDVRYGHSLPIYTRVLEVRREIFYEEVSEEPAYSPQRDETLLGERVQKLTKDTKNFKRLQGGPYVQRNHQLRSEVKNQSQCMP